jgi:hypothetical protein
MGVASAHPELRAPAFAPIKQVGKDVEEIGKACVRTV